MADVIVDGEKPAKKTRATRIKTVLPVDKAIELRRDPKITSIIRRSTEQQIKLTNPTDFFEKMSKPVESRLYTFMQTVKEKSEEQLDTNGFSRVIEFNRQGQWRWRTVKSSSELKSMLTNEQQAFDHYMKMKESSFNDYLKGRENDYGGYGFANDTGSGASISGLPQKGEFMPLIGTPFYKQLYLYDYWEMHSKCFWFKNYSGIAKLVIDMTRNFVLGKGFNVSFEDQSCQDIWNKYEERSNIQEECRNWCDELTAFGENMLKKIPTPKGIMHRSFDPSTIWEIVTDPEDIGNIKYYHQQYNTQYQIFSTKDAPVSKYIINQLPPELVLHTKVNVTSYEKRGRSDLLAVLLYFKYYEDYMTAKLLRAKNEAAFIWDVEIDGSDEDVSNYINSTQNIQDVPPGSENVHNKAIKRTAIAPALSRGTSDQTAQDILSYVAMGVSIPANYMGTFGQSGNTKAGALVATEPVAKKMLERQLKMEVLIRRVVKDVLVDAGKNPADPKYKFEVNFPEILEEDRSAKIQDLVIAKQEQVMSHQTFSYIVAKELKITKYDYEDEQAKIKKEMKENPMLMNLGGPDGLTPDGEGDQTEVDRSVDRKQIKKDNQSF